MWGTLINSLTDRPENHVAPKVKTVETAKGREVKARMTAETEAKVLEAIGLFGEATVAMVATEVTSHTEKYLGAVLNRLYFKGKLDYEYKKDDKSRRKFWRLP
jgi:hypothetical protein